MPLPASETTPVIQCTHVSFSYGHSPILHDVSFQIGNREFVGIIGPNGGGKTTLLRLILGFITPSYGQIAVFGHSPHIRSPHPIRVAYVPQSLRIDRAFPISVQEVVLGGLLSHLPWHGRLSAHHRYLSHHALCQVGLSHLAHMPFGTLSGGQAQRVLIARALVSNPLLLLLDEPTASLDQQAEADIYSILRELKSHMTIVMVTHDLGAAMAHAERFLCVKGGVTPLKPDDICPHVALGLYHPLSSVSSPVS